jgi:excisionase family DNA binding protein
MQSKLVDTATSQPFRAASGSLSLATFNTMRATMNSESVLPTPTAEQQPRQPLTLEQAAWVIGVSPRSVRRLIAAGKLRKLPLTRAIRISFEDLERFIKGEPPMSDAPTDIP